MDGASFSLSDVTLQHILYYVDKLKLIGLGCTAFTYVYYGFTCYLHVLTLIGSHFSMPCPTLHHVVRPPNTNDEPKGLASPMITIRITMILIR